MKITEDRLAVARATYWTIRQNWDGRLWPRLWPNQRYAWAAIEQETGKTKREVEETCDWALVRVRLVEEVPRCAGRGMGGVMKYTIALALLALVGCRSDTQTLTVSHEPLPDAALTEQSLITERSLLYIGKIGYSPIHRCAAVGSKYDIGDQSEEREVVIEPWVYDLLFPPECEERLLVDAPNMKLIPVRGEVKP